MLRINMETVDAYICFERLLKSPLLNAFYLMDMARINPYLRAMESCLKQHCLNVWQSMCGLQLDLSVFLFDWFLIARNVLWFRFCTWVGVSDEIRRFMTLYSKTMSLDCACRLWDLYWLDGDIILFKAAVAIFKTLNNNVSSIEDIMGSLRILFATLNEDQLVQQILVITIDESLLSAI